jgi:hypothetical protein
MELPRSSRSAGEVEALWDYLARRLERLSAQDSQNTQTSGQPGGTLDLITGAAE